MENNICKIEWKALNNLFPVAGGNNSKSLHMRSLGF
jgi:hypothetical protein